MIDFIHFISGVATTDKKVKVYDVRMLKLQQLYTAHQGPVSQVSKKSWQDYIVIPSHGMKLRAKCLLDSLNLLI